MEQVEFDRWIDAALVDGLSDAEVADLALALARSGDQFRAAANTADLASTGGPGSLSTLIAPLALVSAGKRVPKLGVPGRPAGGVDVLAQIPGYAVSMDDDQARKVILNCGYVHLVAGGRYAPADARMFARRQERGAQANPALAIASLLSKKLAMGIEAVGLEVRVGPHGNFGSDLVSARDNAQRFCRIARACSIDAVCFLTPGSLPQQPYIGRGEALLAMSLLLSSDAGDWLARHERDCLAWSQKIAGGSVATRTQLRQAFVENVVAQGGSMGGLEDKVVSVAASHSRSVHAQSDGWIRYDLGGIRSAILSARGNDEDGRFLDTAGVILLAESGSWVKAGAPIASVRCEEETWDSFSAGLSSSMALCAEPWEKSGSGPVEVVRV
ncbi:thymidine phosphorylase [Devosia yakushimensis]|uniref:thymidine phosphorylase n=1 Tax=Devosia yakushimensis TaxID=470028 RepID=A0ABQ5UHB7_9HYPH|nr:hypothetical protein [Devosia yakushimensis]GLQ11453.1 thymidine phosphorylase [Devosia yakushimensis]